MADGAVVSSSGSPGPLPSNVDDEAWGSSGLSFDRFSGQGWVWWWRVFGGDWWLVHVLARCRSFVAWLEDTQPRLGGGKYGGGDAAAVATPARQRCWLSWWLLFGLAGGWAWVLLPGLGLFDLNCFYFLAFSCLLFSIITHLLVIGV